MVPRRYRSAALQVAAVAILLGALGVALAGIVPGAREHLRHVSFGWLAAEIVLELIACACYALLFHGVFSHGAYRLSHVRSAQIAVGELGAFVVTPTGAGGPALRIWALLRLGMPFRIQMVRTVIHAVIFNVPYVLAALLLGLSVVFGVGSLHARVILALAPLGLVIGSILLAGLAATFSRRQRGVPRSRSAQIGRDIVDAIPQGLRELPGRLRELRLSLFSIGYWAGDCGALVVAFHTVHGSAPIAVIALAYMLGQLGNSVPLPGGVGAVEPAMLGVLASSGVNLGLGAAAVVMYRLVSLGLQAVLGTVAVATLIQALGGQRDAGEGSTQDQVSVSS